ncbi:UNVERIFIED_CONTAM: hypothetical protein HDU68_008300 [Siphonaria sp. JEL0065]|nr:hypothetical protein HDU68_008300 [Siphonaria sp. JEL0065]
MASTLATTLTSLGFMQPAAATASSAANANAKAGTRASVRAKLVSKKPLENLESETRGGLDTKLEWIFASNAEFAAWISDAFGGENVKPLEALDLSLEKLCQTKLFGFNVLSEDEALAYKEIKQAGLLPSHSSNPLDNEFNWYHETDDDIDDEIAELENELQDLQQYTNVLDKQEASLNHTKVHLQQQTYECIQEDEEVTNCLEKHTAALGNVSIKVDLMLKDLHERIGQVIHHAASSDSKERTLTDFFDCDNYYLFQCTEDMESFMREDEMLSENLISFYEDEFDDKSGVTGQNQVDEYFSYASADERKSFLTEMDRLTELHAITEQQYLDALLALAFAERKLDHLKEMSITTDNLTHIKNATKQHLQSSKTLHPSIHQTIQTRLLTLWIDHAHQSVKTPILKKDYEAKINRQRSLLRRLETFVGILLNQQSRHQFLAIAFETEVAMIKRFAHILESVGQELERKGEDVGKRLEWYKTPEFAVDKLPNRLIDGRDTFMKAVMQELEMDDALKDHAINSIVFSSIDTVIAKAKSLVQEIKDAKKECMVVEVARQDAVKKMFVAALVQGNNDLLVLLHQYSATCKPINAPKEWYTMQIELRNTANELQPLLRTAAKDVDSSQRIIEYMLSAKP